MRANQLRLWFASMGYVLICALRQTSQRYQGQSAPVSFSKPQAGQATGRAAPHWAQKRLVAAFIDAR